MEVQEQTLRSHYADVRRRLMAPKVVRPKPQGPVKQEEPLTERVMIPEYKLIYFKSAFIQFDHPKTHCPPVLEIFKAVARFYGVTLLDMKSARRAKEIVRPRHVAMYLAKTMTTRSLPFISCQMGGRDHTTCLSAVRRITTKLETDYGLRAEVNTVRAQILEGMRP